MKTIIIKNTSAGGCDSQIFRAYSEDGKPLGLSCSTTGNPSFAVRTCAAKVFIRDVEPGADVHEIETRIGIKNISSGKWRASLQSKIAGRATAGRLKAS